MTNIRIQEVCNRCDGTGTDDRLRDSNGEPFPGTCSFCSGDGWIQTDKINIDDIMDRFDDLENKLDDIKEVVDEL